jgi:hypothetical protein
MMSCIPTPTSMRDVPVAHVMGLRASDERGPLLFYRGGYGGFA